MPDGILFGSSNAHQTIRKLLVENHKLDLDGVISMPSGIFKPYTGVSTAILMFTKTEAGGTDQVWFYDTGKWFLVPKDEIVKNNYDLSINRYKELQERIALLIIKEVLNVTNDDYDEFSAILENCQIQI